MKNNYLEADVASSNHGVYCVCVCVLGVLLLSSLERYSVGVCRRVLDMHTGNEPLQSEHSLLFFSLSLQIFDEEYAVLYLDQGGALVAIRHTPLPIRHLW